MQKPLKHILHKNTFWLSAERCMYWEEEKALILADLHFGKTGHFRKSGIAIPQAVYKEDLQRLVSQIQFFKPKQLIIVGDLFHSEANKELDLFKKWRKDFSSIQIHLIKGNHDILNDDWYKDADLEIYDEEPARPAGGLIINNFCFRHSLQLSPPASPLPAYFFTGHIHPAIHLNGIGKQSLRFPCFYFSKKFAVLPAFSRFTGTHLIDPEKEEAVFAIVQDKIIQIL